MSIEVTTCKPIKSPRTRAALMNVAQALLKESDIEQTCSEWLALDGWRRLRTDPVSDRATVQQIRAALRKVLAPAVFELVNRVISKNVRGKGFGELGMADDLYIRYQPKARLTAGVELADGTKFTSVGAAHIAASETMWIEWKFDKGEAAAHQLEWHAAETARGGFTLIAGRDFAKTIEGFMAWYRRSGLMRRKI